MFFRFLVQRDENLDHRGHESRCEGYKKKLEYKVVLEAYAGGVEVIRREETAWDRSLDVRRVCCTRRMDHGFVTVNARCR